MIHTDSFVVSEKAQSLEQKDNWSMLITEKSLFIINKSMQHINILLGKKVGFIYVKIIYLSYN
jgi:hypothetical protein